MIFQDNRDILLDFHCTVLCVCGTHYCILAMPCHGYWESEGCPAIKIRAYSGEVMLTDFGILDCLSSQEVLKRFFPFHYIEQYSELNACNKISSK